MKCTTRCRPNQRLVTVSCSGSSDEPRNRISREP
jgi:hypothetical protein